MDAYFFQWGRRGAATGEVSRECSVKKRDIKNGAKFWHSCFSVNFVTFLRTSFLKKHLWWLFLLQQNL